MQSSVAVKNLFDLFAGQELDRKLLNIRSAQMLKFAEISALVPFSTATAVFDAIASDAALRQPAHPLKSIPCPSLDRGC